MTLHKWSAVVRCFSETPFANAFNGLCGCSFSVHHFNKTLISPYGDRLCTIMHHYALNIVEHVWTCCACFLLVLQLLVPGCSFHFLNCARWVLAGDLTTQGSKFQGHLPLLEFCVRWDVQCTLLRWFDPICVSIITYNYTHKKRTNANKYCIHTFNHVHTFVQMVWQSYIGKLVPEFIQY